VRNGGTSGGDGGGILNLGELHLTSVTVSQNIALSGGGIRNEGTLTLANCTVSGNHAPLGDGGGISNTGSLSIADSAIVQNTGEYGGGGIGNENTLTVTNSTISGNDGRGGVGGGLTNQAGTATITGSTVSGNTVNFNGAPGGGLYNAVATGTPVATLTNVTLTLNTVVNGAGPGIRNEGSVTLDGTIVAGNGCSGVITSAGHNLETGTTCGFSGTGDLSGVPDARLGGLDDNGGPTQTHSLLFDSPARDAGGASCLPTDQRGITRPQGAACDIGAFEWTDLIFQDGFESS